MWGAMMASRCRADLISLFGAAKYLGWLEPTSWFPHFPLCPSQHLALAMRINSTQDPPHTPTACHYSEVKIKYGLTSKHHLGAALIFHAFYKSSGTCLLDPDALPPASPFLHSHLPHALEIQPCPPFPMSMYLW